jgi:hypothetical protein
VTAAERGSGRRGAIGVRAPFNVTFPPVRRRERYVERLAGR